MSGGGGGGGRLFRSTCEPDSPPPESIDPESEIRVLDEGEVLVEGVPMPLSLGADVEPVYEGFLEGEATLVEGDGKMGELTLFIGRGT